MLSLRLETLESRCVFSAGTLVGHGYFSELRQPAVIVFLDTSDLGHRGVKLQVFVSRLSLDHVGRGTHTDHGLGLKGEGEGEPAEFPLGRPKTEIDRERDRSPVSNLIPKADSSSPRTTTVFDAPTTSNGASSNGASNLPQPSTVPAIQDFTGKHVNPHVNPSAGTLPERELRLFPSPAAAALNPPSLMLLTADGGAFSTRSLAALPALSNSKTVDLQTPANANGSTNFSNSRAIITGSLTIAEINSDERRASLESQLGQLYDQYQTPSSAALDKVIDNLAREHQRGQATQFHRNEQTDSSAAPRAHNSKSQPNCERDGGLISLVINRDLSLGDLNPITDVVDKERHAWSTNLGVYRGLDVAGFAMTEPAPIRNVQPNLTRASDQDESTDVAARRPILASVAFLAGIYSLRRVRKSRRLQYASRTQD